MRKEFSVYRSPETSETAIDLTHRKDREQVLTFIRADLLSSLGSKISSAVVYGSTLNEDFGALSDFDILVSMNDTEPDNLIALRQIKTKYQQLGITIDFNVHSLTDLPSTRGEAFWHNNRGIYMQKEISLYGMTLIGENPFGVRDYSKRESALESVRVTNSLVYQARKFIINKEMGKSDRIQIIKFCIYASLYALAFDGIYPRTKAEAFLVFKDHYNTTTDIRFFHDLKMNHQDEITDTQVFEAYAFLQEVDNLVFNKYTLLTEDQ